MIDCNNRAFTAQPGHDTLRDEPAKGTLFVGGCSYRVEQLSLGKSDNEDLSRACNSISNLLNQQTQR